MKIHTGVKENVKRLKNSAELTACLKDLGILHKSVSVSALNPSPTSGYRKHLISTNEFLARVLAFLAYFGLGEWRSVLMDSII